MMHSLIFSPYELKAALGPLSETLKLCSLGGGPGTDVIGVIAAMHDAFGLFPISAQIVDIMSEWELTFSSVINELRFGQQNYGSLSESVCEKWFDWSFLKADLQSKMSRKLKEVLATADIITMIKFVSAAACKETSSMIERIFRILKPGAFVLFVDNAAGGFEELINSAARKYELNAVSAPLRHQHYINETFNNPKYGYRSCYESKVNVQLLIKLNPFENSNKSHLLANLSHKKNFTSSLVPVKQKIHLSQNQNFRIGPKPVNILMNELDTFEPGSSSNCQGSNTCPLSECSPKLDRPLLQTDSPFSLSKSFEFNPSWNSTSHSSFSQNISVRDDSYIHGQKFQNESFQHDMFLNEIDLSPSSGIKPSWNSIPHSSFSQNISVRDDSYIHGPMFQNESFQRDIFLNEIDLSPPYNFPSYPPSLWERMHVPGFQNFTICSKSTDLINEPDILNHGSLSELPVSSFSSPSECSPKLSIMKIQNDFSASHDKFESGITWNLPLSPSDISSNQNRPRRVVIIDADDENDSFEGKLDSNSHLNNKPWSIQASHATCNSRLNIRGTDDSDYSEEKFENDFLWESPVCSSSLLHFKALPIDGQSKNDPLSMPSSHQHLEKSKTPKTDSNVHAHQHKPKRYQTKQSRNESPKLQPFHKHQQKLKAPKKHCDVSVNRHKPNKKQRYMVKQSKQGTLSWQPSHRFSKKHKTSKRNNASTRRQSDKKAKPSTNNECIFNVNISSSQRTVHFEKRK